MNNIDTSRLSLEDVLRFYPEIDYTQMDVAGVWGIATKTKPIRAKHLSALLVDNSVTSKFLIETLEGKETLKKDSIICLGEAGDIWQQAGNKFLSKYSVSQFVDDGWMVCTPKDGNESLVYKVTSLPAQNSLGFSIRGQYGEERVMGGVKVTLQYGLLGDYIVGSQTDSTDRWIVRCSLFDQTYDIKEAIDTKIIKMYR